MFLIAQLWCAIFNAIFTFQVSELENKKLENQKELENLLRQMDRHQLDLSSTSQGTCTEVQGQRRENRGRGWMGQGR